MAKQSSTKTANDGCKSTAEIKHALFLKAALDHIDPLLENGYGFTVSDSKNCMVQSADTHVTIYNRNVKKKIIDHYGDVMFSSHFTAADLGAKIKNLKTIRKVGEALNHSAKQVDYGLDDSFCDAEELKRAWEHTPMPDEWLTFYAALFGISKSLMAKIDLMQMPDVENYADSSDGSDDEIFLRIKEKNGLQKIVIPS